MSKKLHFGWKEDLNLFCLYTYFVAVDVENNDVQFEMAVYSTDFLTLVWTLGEESVFNQKIKILVFLKN